MQHFFILRWSKRKRYERYERYQRNSSRPATHHKSSNSERLRLVTCITQKYCNLIFNGTIFSKNDYFDIHSIFRLFYHRHPSYWSVMKCFEFIVLTSSVFPSDIFLCLKHYLNFDFFSVVFWYQSISFEWWLEDLGRMTFTIRFVDHE